MITLCYFALCNVTQLRPNKVVWMSVSCRLWLPSVFASNILGSVLYLPSSMFLNVGFSGGFGFNVAGVLALRTILLLYHTGLRPAMAELQNVLQYIKHWHIIDLFH